MSMHKARIFASVSIIGGHFIITLLLILFWLKGGYTFDEMVNVFAITTPLLAAYISIVIAFAFNTEIQSDNTAITPLAMFLSISFPTSLWILVCFAISTKAFGVGLTTMDQLIKFVGIAETVMGGYAGTILRNLFPANLSSVQPPSVRNDS